MDCPDTMLYLRASKMSDLYYNKGLRLANAGDLTGAAAALGASVSINKKNINARNLLGLVFYAMGRMGEALREWVLSANYAPRDNAANNYLDDFRNDLTILEKYTEAMRNYNEALRYMTQYSEDLAVIRLKRAIEIIPDFVEALNLLALWHLKQDEKTRAAHLVERVLAIDKKNPFAKRYYQAIFKQKAPIYRRTEEPRPKAPTHAKPPARGNSGGLSHNPFAAQNQKAFGKSSAVPGIISTILGMGVMFLFMYLLVLPGLMSDRDEEIYGLREGMRYQQEAFSRQIAEWDETNQNQTARLATAEGRITAFAEQERNFHNEQRVTGAYVLLQDQRYLDALVMLDPVDYDLLSPDSAALYRIVRQTATPPVEQQFFQIGYGLFNEGNFSGALTNFESVVLLGWEGSTLIDDAFYFLGRIAQEDGNLPLAAGFFENIIENFPDSNRLASAQNRLNQIIQ